MPTVSISRAKMGGSADDDGQDITPQEDTVAIRRQVSSPSHKVGQAIESTMSRFTHYAGDEQ